MESYSSLLERTRVPQPSLQKFAVISIFEKLRSAPSYLNSDSDPGREAITQCLHSNSPAVVDQAVRELCRLVKDSKLDLSRGLLELQSAIEGSDSRFVNVFVKGLGFIIRVGFLNNSSSFRVYSSETHPFVKVLSCRTEVQSELLQQVLLFMVHNKRLGIEEVCEFLRPFLNFSILKVPFSASLSSFARNLISSMASLCCSFPLEAMPVIKLLMECIKNFPRKNTEDFKDFSLILEHIVGAYITVLRHLVGMELLVQEAQLCGVELLQTILSSCSDLHRGDEAIFETSKRLLFSQKELGLSYISELSSAVMALLVPLIQSELEHEQLSILKLLIFLLKWKSDNEYVVRKDACGLTEELLFLFPVISLMSSPSSSVKQVATDLLLMLEKLLITLWVAPKKELIKQGGFPSTSISRHEHIIFRLLEHLWFQDQTSLCSYLHLYFASTGETNAKEVNDVRKTWASLLSVYTSGIVERRKSSLPISQSQEIFLTETPLLLSSIACVLIMHQTFASSAIDFLAVSGTVDPKLGVPLLLVILFYNSVFSGKDEDINFHDMVLKLLGMLPLLASHPMMTPLIVQTILPMLHKDTKPVLCATAIRLLCKTWEINDRVFGSLQGVLLPKGFTHFVAERNICTSMAVSVRDVCRKNPDRGVDLILSVSACIESQNPIILALGFQSLGHLCEADVIDFYTAWDVIEKYVTYSLENPTVAYCACLLLRWGAMDADAYPEAAIKVVQVLWEVGTSRHPYHGSLRAKARVSALEALSHYEVLHIQRSIPDFKEKNMELLICESDPEVLFAMERLELKIISYEHSIRRRSVKEKKVLGNKIEKLLDVFPQAVFYSGNPGRATELPGAALFCLPLTPKDVNDRRASKGIQDIHANYEKALVEIAESLQLSRNILIALISLQSWKPFMQRWVKAQITFFDSKVSSTVLDKTSKAATEILKSMRRIAEDSIPRSAENIGLAVGALCRVLPPSAHAVKSTASKFLLNWLFQYEHEYRQWTAAISLGLITSCLHLTDHKQKSENIIALIEVAHGSKSILVKGACGVGLGISCQDLLSMVESAADSDMDKETYKKHEADLLGKTVRVLCLMIQQFTLSSSDLLQSISAYFPPGTNDIDSDITSEWGNNRDDWEEDIWGVAGLVIGLANCVGAIYRAGAHDAVLKVKALIISWVPHANHLVQNSSNRKKCEMVLSVGACLALPVIVGFCQKVELMADTELDHLVSGYIELISELESVRKSGTFHQSLLMASCSGAGSLLACILNDGAHSMHVDVVKNLLALFRRTYSNPHPRHINFGGMLGVVNALGAGAGTLISDHPLSSLHTAYDEKESSYIVGPLLSSRVLEPNVASLVQEMFLITQNFEDHQLQQFAAWAISFLRHRLWLRQLRTVDESFQTAAVGTKFVSHSFPEDSVVMKLSSWLIHLNYTGTGAIPHVNTVATSLRCLSQAPRLPTLDWGAIIRRCMRYESHVAELSPPDSALKKGILREQCLKFCLAHAIQFDQLLSFLDELSDLPRFRTLELNLQSCVLLHLAEMIKIFSGSRVQKLFDDLANYFSCLDQVYDPEQKSLIRVSCWKGLYLCMDEASVDSQEYISSMEYCMEVLFSSLPDLRSGATQGVDQIYSVNEWSEAVRCLGKARQGWLLDLLQVSEGDLIDGDLHFVLAVKRLQAKARLVRFGSIPVSELGKLRVHILNSRSDGIWDVLTEVVAALQHAEGSVRRQWLVDALEISCVTNYPSTALRFIGLLCGSCSKYMPLLIVDPSTVLSDLPVTLASLLSETSWGFVAESLLSYLWTLTERIYDWATRIARGDDTPSPQPINESENAMAAFLMRVVYHTCVSVRVHLPHDKQLRLANMVVP